MAVATAEPGISARPQGDAFYNWALRSSTTTRLTPEEVHQQGLEELHTRPKDAPQDQVANARILHDLNIDLEPDLDELVQA